MPWKRTQIERGRMLAKILGKVTLRCDGARLLAGVKGNLPGFLEMDEEVFGKAGAGRGFAYYP